MRKLLIILVIFALLAGACSAPASDPGLEPDPGLIPAPEPEPDPEPEPEPEPAPQPEPDPGISPEDLPEGAELIWQTKTPSDYIGIAGNSMLYLSDGTINALNLETGLVQWTRDFGGDGFAFDNHEYDYDVFEVLAKITDMAVTYSLIKDGQLFIEQLAADTGEVRWRREIGGVHETSFFWNAQLIEVTYGRNEDYSYYDYSSGAPLPFLDESIALMDQGYYYSVKPGKSTVIAKFEPQSGQNLWEAVVNAELTNNYAQMQVSREGDYVLFRLWDKKAACSNTVAVNDISGDVLWCKPGYQEGSQNGRIYLISHDKVSLVDVSTGEVHKELIISKDAKCLEWKGALYISESETLTKISLETGGEIWRLPMFGPVRMFQGVTRYDHLRDMDILWLQGSVPYQGDYNKEKLLAVAPDTGAEIADFSFTVPHAGPEAYPIRLARDQEGRIYILLRMNAHISHQQGPLLIIDVQTGAEIIDGDTIVVATTDYRKFLYLDKQIGNLLLQVPGEPIIMLGDRFLMAMNSGRIALIQLSE